MFYAAGADSPAEINGGKRALQVHFCQRRQLEVPLPLQPESDDEV